MNNPVSKKIRVRWGYIYDGCEKIQAMILKSTHKVESIYGIKRGGLIPAVMVSHLLNVPMVSASNITSNTLIVDDIEDSGKTLKEFRRTIGKTFLGIAVLVTKIPKTSTTLFAAHIAQSHEVIIFPWEAE